MHENDIPVLLAEYSATLSETDQKIFDTLRLYEEKGGIDISKFYPLVWGPVGLERYASLKQFGPALWNRPTSEEVLKCLDPRRMKRSCQRLPLQMTMSSVPEDQSDAGCYDPRFLLPLFLTLLEPHSLIDLRQFAIGKSCLGYTISCLSLHDRILRGAAYAVLFQFRQHLRSYQPVASSSASKSKNRFLEKPQILYILNLFRHSLEKPLTRIPCIGAAFLARVIQLTAMPWDPVYSTINNFLLIKPKLDLWDLPEFYKLFQSASSDERSWILRLMADSLREAADYRIYERRNAFRLILPFYDCVANYKNEIENTSRIQILKIITAACRIGSASSDLCYRYNLLGWLTSVVQSIKTWEDAEILATIFNLIHKNVLKKENTPEYVEAIWRGGAILLKERASDLEGSGDEDEKQENRKGWVEFLEVLG